MATAAATMTNVTHDKHAEQTEKPEASNISAVIDTAILGHIDDNNQLSGSGKCEHSH